MRGILLLTVLFFLAAHGFPFLTWEIAIILLLGWVRYRVAGVRWARWWIRKAPKG